jgi:glycosyltransferase involved in cell wall biosynthesis
VIVRIAIVNQYYRPDLSPTAELAASLAEHRADHGDEVTVITSSARYSAAKQGDDGSHHGVRVWRAPSPVREARSVPARAAQYAVFLVAATWRMLTLPRQDVVIAMTTPPFVAVLAVLHRWRRRKTRLVLWCMDCYPDILVATGLIDRAGVLCRIGHAVNRWLLRRLDHVVCLDEAMKERLVNDTTTSVPTISVIPNWEAMTKFPPPGTTPRWSGLESMNMDGRFVIAYLGNAGYGHDFDAVLDAALRLRDHQVTFLFVGGGTEYKRLGAEAAQLGLDSIRCIPYVTPDEVAPLLGSVDAALVTLGADALGAMSPSKLHGYLASGLPVIYVGPRGGNIDHAIETHKCGVSLRQDDVEGLVHFVQTIRRDPHLRKCYGNAARSAFEIDYCDTAVLPQFDSVITPPPPSDATPAEASALPRPADRSRAGTSSRSSRPPQETQTAR